ncbi:diaminopimelate decarboxylase [Sanguibacter antarcticus]|uniref:Diaminopimelate decarboxylase n=1 Tax=Sanguibacter antarcticus TaxID=372484 RepID=A0A2A9E1T0_9MICO|nr:diaminopimelate decarboxylase [Sanguibacter antarcticus]PFG32606.1 diaminopimelate decarboxylase [Sanguibacter antarcticus]
MSAVEEPGTGSVALDPNVWPHTAVLDQDGELALAGIGATDLAGRFDTPAYILDEETFHARARLFRDAFSEAFAAVGSTVDVYYAGKSFLSVAVARWARADGLRVDTCTGGELAVALRAGVPGAEIGLHGNNKSDSEIARAIDARVGRVVVDSHAEIERIAQAARDAGRTSDDRVPVMVRVTTGIHAGGHEFISTAHEDQKFGISLTGGQALDALQSVLAHPELELLGAHTHIGSQIQDAQAFEVNARKMLGLREELRAQTGFLMPELDLGGGYGIAYLPGEVPIDVRALATDLAQVVASVCTELSTTVPRISIEPGRAIVGSTTVTLYTVGVVKPVTLEDGSVRTYVAVDGGMSDNIRPALYDARYTARLANRTGSAETVRARVVGKHCESGDIVIPDLRLPADIAPGDLLAVPATGAYGRSMASNYNHVLRPPVVVVDRGEARVIVRRETEDDLLALDLG